MAWSSKTRTNLQDSGNPSPRPVSESRIFVFLLISIIINVCLAHFLWRKSIPPHIKPVQSTSSPVRADTSPETRKRSSLKTTVEPLKGQKFTWAMLQSSDPRVYARRLLDSGCPRHVVKTLLANELVDAREVEFAAIPPPPLWSNPPEHRTACLRAYQEQMRITRKYDDLARQIIGMRCLEPLPSNSDFAITDLMAHVLIGPASLEKIDDFLRTCQRISEQEELLSHLPPLSRYRAWAEFSRWGEQTLSGIIGDMHEFKKRSAAVVLAFSSDLPDYTQTGCFIRSAELEQASDALAREIQLDDIKGDLEKAIEDKARRALKNTLSTARFSEFQRAKDDAYLNVLRNSSSETPVRQAAAAAIYDLKQQAETAWLALQQDTALNLESRRARFNMIRQDCTRRAEEILGTKGFQELGKQKPYWMLPTEEPGP